MFFVRFWKYYKKKTIFISLEIELYELFAEFFGGFIILSVIDLIIWLIS